MKIFPSTENLIPVRCPLCSSLLGYAWGTVQIKCQRCKKIHLVDIEMEIEIEKNLGT
jgi:LSD1 subclass zinc finger protein